MNTPTPRTDAALVDNIDHIPLRKQIYVKADVARQLEQELNEAKLKAADRNGWQEVAMKVSAERDTLKRERDEAIKERDCWTFNANELQKTVNGWERERRELISKCEIYKAGSESALNERDQLRKVADELAVRLSQHDGCSRYHREDAYLLSNYSQLPHVLERGTK